MEKVMVGKRAVGPAPAVIAGAIVNGKPNFLAVGCYGVISPNLSLIYISIRPERYTNIGIKENGYFSINWPSKDLVKQTDYVGLVSGQNVDKSKIFNVFYGSNEKAPLIEECPINMACKLYQIFNVPTRNIFIGEVLETFVNKDCCENNKPNLKTINPLLIGTNKYWELGSEIGDAYKIGKVLIK
jgi:flavin reductase (DIM6/NTAB) family NADH-FMN oxidoreductase RutF